VLEAQAGLRMHLLAAVERTKVCDRESRPRTRKLTSPYSDNKSLHLRLLDLEEWRASLEASPPSSVIPTALFALPLQPRTILQSFATNSTIPVDDILVLALELLHITLHQFTNYNAAKSHSEVSILVEAISTTSPVPITYFYDHSGRRACVSQHLIDLLPAPQLRVEYKAALRNVLWLHPVGHLSNLLDRVEILQDHPSSGTNSVAEGLSTYALAAATWALASLSHHAASTPPSSSLSSSTTPIHENLPESLVLYTAARTALTLAENADPARLGHTDVFYAAILMMVFLTHASALQGTHLPTSGLPANDFIHLEIRRLLAFIQRFWKSAGWFADPADGPTVDPNRVTSHWEREERRRLSSAILYYEQ
jgi:hypothetical protein